MPYDFYRDFELPFKVWHARQRMQNAMCKSQIGWVEVERDFRALGEAMDKLGKESPFRIENASENGHVPTFLIVPRYHPHVPPISGQRGRSGPWGRFWNWYNIVAAGALLAFLARVYAKWQWGI